jgi:hypothetical protein
MYVKLYCVKSIISKKAKVKRRQINWFLEPRGAEEPLSSFISKHYAKEPPASFIAAHFPDREDKNIGKAWFALPEGYRFVPKGHSFDGDPREEFYSAIVEQRGEVAEICQLLTIDRNNVVIYGSSAYGMVPLKRVKTISRWGLKVLRDNRIVTEYFGSSIADLADKHLRANGGEYRIVPAPNRKSYAIVEHLDSKTADEVALGETDTAKILEAYLEKKCIGVIPYEIVIAPDGELLEIDGMSAAEYLSDIVGDKTKTSLTYAEYIATQATGDDAFIAAQGWA